MVLIIWAKIDSRCCSRLKFNPRGCSYKSGLSFTSTAARRRKASFWLLCFCVFCLSGLLPHKLIFIRGRLALFWCSPAFVWATISFEDSQKLESEMRKFSVKWRLKRLLVVWVLRCGRLIGKDEGKMERQEQKCGSLVKCVMLYVIDAGRFQCTLSFTGRSEVRVSHGAASSWWMTPLCRSNLLAASLSQRPKRSRTLWTCFSWNVAG